MKTITRATRLFVLTGGLFFALSMGVASADFIFDLTGSPGVDGGTGRIDLTAPSGELLGSFNFTNVSFLASSVPGGITYQYGTNEVSTLLYSFTNRSLTLDLATNIISGVWPPGVDPGIGTHIVFGSYTAFTASHLLAYLVTDSVASPGTFTPGAAIQAFFRPNLISSPTEVAYPALRRGGCWPGRLSTRWCSHG
jgi:hypothetical protein